MYDAKTRNTYATLFKQAEAAMEKLAQEATANVGALCIVSVSATGSVSLLGGIR